MDGKNKKVVIVEDDTDLIKILVIAFQAKGFEVQQCLTGHEALAYFQDPTKIESTALLILDRLLPDMDGIDLLKKIKHDFPSALPFPVLILSVLSAEKDVLQGLELGAIDYIPKPFSLDILMRKASSLINRTP